MLGDRRRTESIAAIHRALEAGINWIDTAAVYGLGHSEEVVGTALKGLRQALHLHQVRDDLGRRPQYRSNAEEDPRRGRKKPASPAARRDRPLPDPLARPDEEIEEGWTTMADLQREGKVRHIGVSNFSVAQMERALKIAPITSLQPPYSMINRSIEAEILPFCQTARHRRHQLFAHAVRPADGRDDQGAHAKMPQDDFRRNTKQFQEPLLSRNLELVELLRVLANGTEWSRRGRNRLDAAQPSDHRGHRRRPQCGAG